MNPELANIDPHKVAKANAYIMGAASVVFALIGLLIILSGNEAFDVNPFSLNIENRFVLLAVNPLIMFALTYGATFLFASLLKKLVQWVQ